MAWGKGRQAVEICSWVVLKEVWRVGIMPQRQFSYKFQSSHYNMTSLTHVLAAAMPSRVKNDEVTVIPLLQVKAKELLKRAMIFAIRHDIIHHNI